MQPNDDNTALDQELQIGAIVYFAPVTEEKVTTPLKVIQIGSSRTTWDYEVESPTGNRFFVAVDNIVSPDEMESQMCQAATLCQLPVAVLVSSSGGWQIEACASHLEELRKGAALMHETLTLVAVKEHDHGTL